MELLVGLYVDTGWGAWNFTAVPAGAGGGGRYNVVTARLIGSGSV